jgi:phage shock protein PspC (stress-responsive transcriptional regulator)
VLTGSSPIPGTAVIHNDRGMSDASAGLPPTPPPSEPGPGEWRTLRRSRSDRYVAGVLGGLARRLDIDPLILRITTVVLAMFGIGMLLYALGWLLIPAEDEDASVAEQAFGRGRASGSRSNAVLLTIGLGLLILISAGAITSGWGEGFILLVLAVVGIALLLRRDDHRGAVPATGGQASPSGPDSTPLTDQKTETTATWAEGPDWEPDRPWEQDQPDWDPFAEPEPAAAQPQRSRSSLWLTTVSVAAVALGIIAINDAIWATVAPATYIATALGIVGLGLLIGAWYGRSRGLIVLGLVLSLALVPAVIFDHADFRGERVEVSPTSVAGIPSGTQEYDVGEVRYDLSAVEFAETDSVTLSIDQGAGELTVVLPPDVDVTVAADLGVGEIQALDDNSGGFGREARIVDDGADGPGGGELELLLDLGVGRIEVDRAAA